MKSAAARPKVFALGLEERAPLSLAVSRRMREAIVSGQIAVGTELPSESELAKDLGVGRSTVREALRILQAQGLLTGGDTVSTQRPRVSAEHTMSMAAHTMENVLRLGQVPLRDLVGVRVVLEGAAVEQAAARGDLAALEDARSALAAMKAPRVGIEAFRAADLRFHQSLAAATGNLAFALVMGVLRSAISAHLGEALHRVPSARAAMTALTREHEAIYEAIARGHGKRARELVTDHIRAFYEAGERV